MRWALRLVDDDALGVALRALRRARRRRAAGSPAAARAWVATWAGRWALGAGGAVEVGEDPVATLARELEEEWSVEPERLAVEALVCLPNRIVDARSARPGSRRGRRGHARPRARRARLVAAPTPPPGRARPTPRCGAWPACWDGRMTFDAAQVPLVRALGDLPDAADRLARARGWTAPSACFGWAHGVGWIVMSLLCIDAVRRRVIPLWLGVTVAVVGGIGPFAGTIGSSSRNAAFEQSRRRDKV